MRCPRPATPGSAPVMHQHEIKLANLARTHQLGGDFRARGRSALCLGCSSHDGEGGHDGQDGEGRERTASAVPAAAATRGDACTGGAAPRPQWLAERPSCPWRPIRSTAQGRLLNAGGRLFPAPWSPRTPARPLRLQPPTSPKRRPPWRYMRGSPSPMRSSARSRCCSRPRPAMRRRSFRRPASRWPPRWCSAGAPCRRWRSAAWVCRAGCSCSAATAPPTN